MLISLGRIENDNDFAQLTNIDRGTMSKLLSGKLGISSARAHQIAEAIPELDPLYLISEDYEAMWKGGKNVSIEGNVNNGEQQTISVSAPDFEGIIKHQQETIDSLIRMNESLHRLLAQYMEK